jgi:hypothetical protein
MADQNRAVSPLDRERDLQLWSAQKWAKVTPPMRPSAGELAFVERVLLEAKPRPGATALILGATPELRSLALKHRLKTAGCDIDENFWHAMTLLRTVEGEEEFIHANWLDIDRDRRFDFILGDCAFTMLSWEDTETLVPRLHEVLANGGVSVQRILTADEALTAASIGPAMEEFRESGPGISLNLYLFFLAGSIQNTYYPEMMNREFFESIVFPYLREEEAASLRPFLIDRKFNYPPRDKMMSLLERYFTIVEEEPCSGPGTWGTASMFVLKKKVR